MEKKCFVSGQKKPLCTLFSAFLRRWATNIRAELIPKETLSSKISIIGAEANTDADADSNTEVLH